MKTIIVILLIAALAAVSGVAIVNDSRARMAEKKLKAMEREIIRQSYDAHKVIAI